MDDERSEQELVRREKLKNVRVAGPAYPNDAVVTHSAAMVKVAAGEAAALEQPPGGESAPKSHCSIAGRLMAVRHMGKAAFCHLQDQSGRVQVYVKRDDVGPERFAEFQSLDLGDIVFFTGYPFITKTGEPSLHATEFRLLVKCLHPLPEKWHGLTDVEVRYRQRYLDLMVNEEVSRTFLARAKIIAAMRQFFDRRGYVEVETPVMSTIASGASARPFVTHHNALDLELHLRIALELPLKKLVVGGLERVYELGRVFRNEGISTEHNPEFTMIEFYQAYATYEDLMVLTEELIVEICDKVLGARQLEFKGQTISFEKPWKRLTMAEAIYEIGEVPRSYDLNTLEGVQSAARFLKFDDVAKMSDYGLALYEIFDRYVEAKIVHPTFITQHPTSISPLARKNASDPRFVDRFELMVAGMELANAFSELNDPADQLERFEDQLRSRQAGNEEAMAMDEDFITALEYGLPPTAGEGIGIDRLVMLLTNSSSIRDVILFPTMRPTNA